MSTDNLDVLAAFVAVAEERSFTKAGVRLGVSTSALSHAMRALEERLGVRLLARTTRSVAPTEAGEQLLAQVGPALGDIRTALHGIGRLRERPAGRLRLVMPRLAASMVLLPRLARFTRECPDVVLDVTTESRPVDIVAGRFDAGIELGEFIQRDMVAIRVSPDQRAAIVASPAYFKTHAKPRKPQDLLKHHCIGCRHGDALYRWEFDKGRKSLTVGVGGPVVLDDVDLMVRAALDGVGIAFTFEEQVAPLLAKRRLVRVLEDWCPPFPGYFIYYPSRRQQPPGLSALIEALRHRP
ncbi:MAG: LysR family transcriptional regulator [Acidobacteria bacterium]|jgi:DNA-binding transcriptional LysR family regulator|nr:LysR family transcriptional regulator [Acidobacteriota bacterium]